MMAETKDIIDALSNGDNLGAEQAFKDTIQAKVGDALEVKRKEVANTFVQSSKVEEDGEEV
jgi:DNA-binding GntR family transcriptional regulator